MHVLESFEMFSMQILLERYVYSEIVGTFILIYEYYGAAEPPVRCGESHLSGLTEPPQFVY